MMNNYNEKRNLDFNNPLILQRADPFIYKHTDGYYYFIATSPNFDKIELRRAKTINDLTNAEEQLIWNKHETGIMGSHIWAPEIHFINNKWYIYFAAGGAEKIWDIRMYVLECEDSNPLDGKWIEKGEIKTKWETFSLDATTFIHNGTQYLIWAQHKPEEEGNTSLYISDMINPWTIKSEQVMISKPDLEWERIGFMVNEGPAVIKKNGKIFVSYSASATDHNYCMGLLQVGEDANLLDATSWNKSQTPVFTTNEKNSQYGPGHNCFTTSEDGKDDILVYHARNYKELKGSPLSDPNRHTRVQYLEWNEDGTPNFGVPVVDNK